MNSHFLNGFVDELTKEAAHPLFTSVKKGGTLLGRKVKGMMSRAVNKGKVKKYRNKSKHGTGDGAMYGGGTGNFGGTQAPAFTADTKKGKIGNPSENPQNFGKKAMATQCGPETSCGKGKHGKGCSLKQKAGSVLRDAIKEG